MGKTTAKSAKKEVKVSKAPAKGSSAKKDHKPAPKKAPEKKADKSHGAHGKGSAKPAVKAAVKVQAKKEAKKVVPVKTPVKPAAAKKIDVKKTSAVPVPPTDDSKKTKGEKEKAALVEVSGKGQKATQKKKPAAKKEEFELEEDLVGEGDDFASDELSEYQAELEVAEEEGEEKEIPVEDVPAPNALSSKEKGDDIILTDAEGRRYCRVKDCDQVATVDGYCRYHYLLLWKKIQVRKKILSDGKLERYIEELTSRYPDKFLEVIRRDLRTEKDFVSAIQEMEIDESGSDSDFEDESSNFIDEVRGASPEGIAEDDEY